MVPEADRQEVRWQQDPQTTGSTSPPGLVPDEPAGQRRRQGTAIAGPERVPALRCAPASCERDPWFASRPFIRFVMRVRARVLLLHYRHPGNALHLPAASRAVTLQGVEERLAVEAITLRPESSSVPLDAGRVQHQVLDALGHEEPVEPGAVAAGLVAAHDRTALRPRRRAPAAKASSKRGVSRAGTVRRTTGPAGSPAIVSFQRPSPSFRLESRASSPRASQSEPGVGL